MASDIVPLYILFTIKVFFLLPFVISLPVNHCSDCYSVSEHKVAADDSVLKLLVSMLQFSLPSLHNWPRQVVSTCWNKWESFSPLSPNASYKGFFHHWASVSNFVGSLHKDLEMTVLNWCCVNKTELGTQFTVGLPSHIQMKVIL